MICNLGVFDFTQVDLVTLSLFVSTSSGEGPWRRRLRLLFSGPGNGCNEPPSRSLEEPLILGYKK